MRRKIPQIICSVVGILMLALFFSRHPTAQAISQTILVEYWQIIFAFTLIVGVLSFMLGQLRGIERGEDRFYKIISLSGVVLMPVLALIWGIRGGTPFVWIFDNVQAPLQSTVFALLAFFVASASLRGFRARSLPAAILLFSAALILFSRSYLGDSTFAPLSEFSDWIRSYPSMAARRAILIGIGLGSLTTSLRVILGIERTWLGGER
ncbi:MAG: hypothetical protein SGI97_03805 [candidate division Zixibacteria bacterium]|nr:hypothetical protein [candidate division Zixibacteria bacterium]